MWISAKLNLVQCMKWQDLCIYCWWSATSKHHRAEHSPSLQADLILVYSHFINFYQFINLVQTCIADTIHVSAVVWAPFLEYIMGYNWMYYPIYILMSICSAVIFILGATINSKKKKKKDDEKMRRRWYPHSLHCASEVSEGNLS